MGTLRRILLSTVATSVVACTNIEWIHRSDPVTGFSATACTFIGPKRGFERPTWQIFEPDPRDGIVHVRADTASVVKTFATLGYKLDRVRLDGQEVPRFLLANLPYDLPNVASTETRKEIFLASMLPVALYVNEKVLDQRRVLEAMRDCMIREARLDSRAKAWLRAMADLYDSEPEVDRLLLHVDAVPPSLLLAQAAIESAWGTSRFAHEGNAIFGEYIYERDRGMLPRALTVDARFRVRHFDHVVESVVSYVRNLNSHPAYEGFRARRAQFRALGGVPSGDILADDLARYSERRQAYVRDLRAVIRVNRLGALDDAMLEPTPTFRVASRA